MIAHHVTAHKTHTLYLFIYLSIYFIFPLLYFFLPPNVFPGSVASAALRGRSACVRRWRPFPPPRPSRSTIVASELPSRRP